MENLIKKIYDLTKSETIRGLANKCKTEKQLLTSIQNLRLSKAINRFKNYGK